VIDTFAATAQTAIEQGQFVNLITPHHPAAPLVGEHDYAVLDYDPSSNEFLLYNPWGPEDATTLFVGASITSPTIHCSGITSTDQTATSLVPGDVIEIDSELMLVGSVTADVTHDGNYTLHVTRGYDGTTPADHSRNAGVFLELIKGAAPWGQLARRPIPNSVNGEGEEIDGLFAEPPAFLDDNNNFGEQERTGSASPGSGAAAGAPAVNALALRLAAANVANALIAPLGASPSGGYLLGMSLAQAATLDPPQWEPANATAAISQNRLQAVDAVFAAGAFADQGQGTGLDNGNLSSDDSDVLFLPDGPDSWGVKLTELRTGLRIAPRLAKPLTE
jgi:hypothetical protein